MKLDIITVGGNHPMRMVDVDPTPERLEAWDMLADEYGHIVTVMPS